MVFLAACAVTSGSRTADQPRHEDRKYAQLRADAPAINPQDLVAMTFGHDASERDVAEVFRRSTDDTLSQEQTLWEFWHALARCGIYVDRLYRQSEWVSQINACASGPDEVPCVKVRSPRATIHWFLTKDTKEGRLRLDGNSTAVDMVRHMLRKAFPPYVVGGLHVALSQRRNREEI